MGIFSKIFGSQKSQTEVDEVSARMQAIAFPCGQAQIEEEAAQLHTLLRGRVAKGEVQRLLVRNKRLLVIASDKSEARVVPSILNSANGQLSEAEAKLVYEFLTGVTGELYSGGDGSSRDNAIIINATSSISGIEAEHKWLEPRYGQQDRDWKVQTRLHGQSRTTGRAYETFVISLSDGGERTVHFDISSFYGRG